MTFSLLVFVLWQLRGRRPVCFLHQLLQLLEQRLERGERRPLVHGVTGGALLEFILISIFDDGAQGLFAGHKVDSNVLGGKKNILKNPV